jgi:hypothetical protein
MAMVDTGQRDTYTEVASERLTTQLVGPLLLVAVAAGLLGQGAYYRSLQWPFGVHTSGLRPLSRKSSVKTRLDRSAPPTGS